MAYKLTDKEKDANLMMKNLLKKPTRLKASYFTPGAIIMYTYRAKTQAPYDMSPMIFVLGRKGRYTYGINFHWVPPMLRKGIVNLILDRNKTNIKKGKPLNVPKTLVKQIFRMGVPAFRKYLNVRISPKGIVIPHTMLMKAVNLRAESFIGISSDDAWKIAVDKLKANKREKRWKKYQKKK